MNPDGSGQTNLTKDPAEDTDPVWSPDGTRIAFVKESEGHRNIYVMNADGTGQTNLTPGPVTTGQANEGTNPTWSPDGSRIAYTNANGDIWVMNADGSGKTNLTRTLATVAIETQPAWSPDGSRIAYVRDADIWVMNADGTNQRPLTATTGALQDEKAPDWSPDGSQIVYGKGSAVWVMNADGTNQHQILANSVLPAWSPDGTKITFSSSSFGAPNGPDIFVANPDGTGVTRLPTAVPPTDTDPNWQPAQGGPTTSTSTSTSTTSTSTTSSTSTSTTSSTTTPASTSTTSSTTTTVPPTTSTSTTSTSTTSTTILSDVCRQILNSQLALNAEFDRARNQILQTVQPPERDRLLLQLEAQRAQRNAEFQRALERNQCPPPTTTTTVPTSTTTTTTTTTTPADRCAQIRESRQAFNASIDAQRIAILQNTPPQFLNMALAQLEALRAQRNAEFDRQLAENQCLTTTTTSTTTTSTTTTTRPSDRCAQIRQSQQAFNADIEARETAVGQNLEPRVRESVLAQLEAAQARGNAEFDRQLLRAQC